MGDNSQEYKLSPYKTNYNQAFIFQKYDSFDRY